MVWATSFFGGTTTPEESALAPLDDQDPLKIAQRSDVAKTVDEALECDYERDCTPLYKKIESEDWNGVAKYLDTGYWPATFFADTVPPADQARTWVTRFDPHDSKKVRWSQLPLHLAIVIEAPYEIVGRLIELYPQAVRCTDDQHMLPLHLAMRHGSTDRIVDLLLAAFPDAVNAKGKNDRTPIECAIRGPNKARGRILNAFVEKTKAKATKTAAATYNKELNLLKAKLQDKDQELDELRLKYAALETAKEAIQLELMSKIQELEHATMDTDDEAQEKFNEYQSDRLVEELEIQKKFETLEKEKAELEASRDQVRQEESSLRRDLDTVQERVAATTPYGLDQLKEEIAKITNFRLEASRNQTTEELDLMKKQLAEDMLKTDDATKVELKNVQQTVNELRGKCASAKTNGELITLKEEVASLHKQLKEKGEARKTKGELVELKTTVEKEIAKAVDSNLEHADLANKIVMSVDEVELENKTNDELAALKKDMEALRKEMKERELADRTKAELEALKTQLNEQLAESEGKTKQELKLMKQAVENISVKKLENQTNDELINVKKELNSIKEQLKETEKASKMKLELAMLRKSLEAALHSTQGKNKEEIDSIKSAIKLLDKKDMEKKSLDDLSTIKKEVSEIKDEMLLKEESKKLKSEFDELRKKVTEQLETSEGKTKEEMLAFKASVEAIDPKKIETKNREQFEEMKSELMRVHKSMNERETTSKLKIELTLMKKALEAEVARAQDKSRSDVVALKRSVEKLTEQNLKSQNTEQLAMLKLEIENLKREVKEKDQAAKDLESMKSLLEKHLKESDGKEKEQLTTMKAAVDAIDVKAFEKQNQGDWLQTKAEITSLKRSVNEVQSQAKTRKDLEILKEALELELQSSAGKTKEELATMKMAVEAIDLKKLEKASREEWEALETEIEALKRELKIKECESLLAQLDQDLKKHPGLNRSETAQFRKTINALANDLSELSYYDLVDKKREIKALADELAAKKNTGVRSKSPLPDEAVVTGETGLASASAPTTTGKKRGIRKMFGRIFSGKKASTAADKHDSDSEAQDSVVSPPSISSSQKVVVYNSDSSTSDEERKLEKEKAPRNTETAEEEKKEEEELPSYLPGSKVAPTPVAPDDASTTSKHSTRSSSSKKSTRSARSQKSLKSTNASISSQSVHAVKDPLTMDPALAPTDTEAKLDTVIDSQKATAVVTTEGDDGTIEVETVVSSQKSQMSQAEAASAKVDAAVDEGAGVKPKIKEVFSF